MNKETSDPFTVGEGHTNDPSHHARVSCIKTSSSAKISSSVDVIVSTLLANGNANAAEKVSFS